MSCSLPLLSQTRTPEQNFLRVFPWGDRLGDLEVLRAL